MRRAKTIRTIEASRFHRPLGCRDGLHFLHQEFPEPLLNTNAFKNGLSKVGTDSPRRQWPVLRETVRRADDCGESGFAGQLEKFSVNLIHIA